VLFRYPASFIHRCLRLAIVKTIKNQVRLLWRLLEDPRLIVVVVVVFAVAVVVVVDFCAQICFRRPASWPQGASMPQLCV